MMAGQKPQDSSPSEHSSGTAASPSIPWFLRSRSRLFSTLLLVLGLLMGTLALLLSTQARRSLEAQAVHRNAATARLIAPVVQEHFGGLTSYVESFARRPSVVGFVEKRDTEGARGHLEDLVAKNPKFDRAFIADPDGFLWSDYPPAPEVIEQNFSWRDWFRGVSERQATYVSKVYQRTAPPQPHLVAIATPIRNSRDRTIGYLVAQHTVDALIRWLGQIEPSAGGSAALIDHEGVLASMSDGDEKPPPSLASHPLVRKALAGQQGSEQTADPVTGEESLVSYASIAPIGWVALARQPITAVLAPIRALQQTIAGLTLVTFAVMVVLGFLWLDTMRRYHEALEASNRARKRYLRELSAANKELEAFSYSVSHDLRGPLRAIDGFGQALLEDYGERLDAEGQDYLARVRAAARRMGQLIDDLLKLSRITRSEIRREEVDLSGLAHAIALELREQDPQRQAEFAIDPAMRAHGDRELLRIALENLLGNAWKFTRDNEDARIEFSQTEHEDGLAYFVRDNGVGFDMAYGDKVFGAFQRLHDEREFPGTGVGLATVQRIVHKHGGRVWTRAEAGKGATFYFTL